MESFWTHIQSFFLNIEDEISQFMTFKIAISILILILSQALKHYVFSVAFHRLENITRQTDTSLDDELINILKQPLGWLLLLISIWLVQLILANELSPGFSQSLNKILGLLIVITISYALYQLAPILGRITGLLTVRTQTELDDLILPYLPKLFRIAAILIAVLKGSEVLLGVSATAIVGILGGAGLALGLLIKDVIYDWCCTVIIYLDNLYRTGDYLIVTDVDGQVQVLEIGLRSTKLGILESNSIKKIPNSAMITGIVENRSQKINSSQP